MINFKDDRLKNEYEQLPAKNPRMHKLLSALSTFCEVEFKKDLTITCILRTKEENEQLYAHTPIDKRPASSPHMSWEGVDLRSFTFKPDEIQRMVKFLNNFTYRNSKPVSIFHTVAGNAPHFHIQFAANL